MIWEITEIRNSKSLNEENTDFDLEMNHPIHGWIPYTLNLDDPDDSISNEQLLSLIGSNYAAFVPPTSEEIIQEQAADARSFRSVLLENHVDPLVSNSLRWNDMTDSQRNAWTTYRQELLDITKQSGFPQNITWPTMPEET